MLSFAAAQTVSLRLRVHRLAYRGIAPDPVIVGCSDEERIVMTDRNEALVREAYEATSRGNVAGMLEFVDPDLEWTYLDPAFESPEPETCHGREQLQ